MMPEKDLTQQAVLLGEHDYVTAIDYVISAAQKQLLIFDCDLSKGGFNSIARHALIQEFLNKSPVCKLTFILHDANFLKTQCPRLLALLKTYGHQMQVLITNDHAKIAKDCFVIADDNAYVRRFHIDQARFKYALDDIAETANLHLRFNELLDETAETVSATHLGL